MVQLYLHKMDQLQENSKMKLMLDKLVSIYQSQYLYLCSHLQEIRDHSMEMLTFMVKLVLDSSLK